MNKKIQSAFTFGVLLVIVGIIGTFLQWQQAYTIIGLGILFELYATLLFIWKKIKNTK